MADKFFLGSFSPDGFRGSFSDIVSSPDNKTIILKGGAGTGKSSLMKKISAKFESGGQVTEFRCSSDPASLDAVAVGGINKVVVDGTAPHVLDPVYPGVRQRIVNLGDCWDQKKLMKRETEIVSLTDEHKKLMERTKRYVQALSSVFSDTFSVAEEVILSDKLQSFAVRLSKKIAPKRSGKIGQMKLRQLSALTPEGYVTFSETLDGYDIYMLRDPYFAGSDIILRELADIFTARGVDVCVSLCNMFSQPVYEHIFMPEMKLAFVTADPLTKLNIPGVKPINMQRFYDKQGLSLKKYRLRLNRNACADLTSEAVKTMKTALKVHNSLESIYISSMDFSKVDIKADSIIRSFEKEAKHEKNISV